MKRKIFLLVIEIVEDKNISKDLDQLANALVKKFERLQILSKKTLMMVQIILKI